MGADSPAVGGAPSRTQPSPAAAEVQFQLPGLVVPTEGFHRADAADRSMANSSTAPPTKPSKKRAPQRHLHTPLPEYSLFDTGWPDPDRFPQNSFGAKVRRVVDADLLSSRDPLVITGFTSLDTLVDLLAKLHARGETVDRVRLLLGHDPYPSVKQNFRYPETRLVEEISDYWLERGVSLFLSAQLLAALDLFRKGIARARISGPDKIVHAKVYKADGAVTIGSSNYSGAGLMHQIEANVRFTAAEADRLDESRRLAEQIWELGVEYTGPLVALLEQLLQAVTWQEALARACAEILEGPWARKYILPSRESPALWPSQTQGLAQAMWVLENVGSVLVADATGSGKTRMGAHLIGAAVHRLIWGAGRIRDGMWPILVCPSSVQDDWKAEVEVCRYPVDIYSDGMLSQSATVTRDRMERQLRRAQLLAMDEAHRFLNPSTQRTRRVLFNNLADYVLLFTATPVNRGPRDLLAIVDLLGADNFDDDVLDILEGLLGRRQGADEALSASERSTLQRAIQRFTVRRTKAAFNRMIDAEPDAYLDADGRPCRFPEHFPRTYSCGETEQDCALAQEIADQTQRLRGLVNLRSPIELTEAQRVDLRRWDTSEQEYLDRRLSGAKALARHQIMSSLRSSRTALIECLRGTDHAWGRLKVPRSTKSTNTGNTIGTLKKLPELGPPAVHLTATVPDWLEQPACYTEACAEEIEVYEEIERLAERISDAREESKARLLVDLLKRHHVLLAFDSRLITLADLHHRIKTLGPFEVEIATGGNPAGRKRVKEWAGRGSTSRDKIALCSDAMSEGLNLQAASAVVHLDMPTVIRTAEQRAGRVDRLDSPYGEIEVWWPDDSAEFRLRADEHFYVRYQFVADVLGANFKLPNDKTKPLSTQQLIHEIQSEGASFRSWDGLGDAFEPVRGLIDGENPLVPSNLYERLRTSRARVISSVSAVTAESGWAFFAVSGTEWGAPRWIYLEEEAPIPIVDLENIGTRLRSRLAGQNDRSWDAAAAERLNYFLQRLAGAERLLLPRKKQHSLEEMKWVLERYWDEAIRGADVERQGVVRAALGLLDERNLQQRAAEAAGGLFDRPAVDLSALAEHWLDLIRPTWYAHLKQRGRPRILRLKHLRSKLVGEEKLSTECIRELVRGARPVRPVDERVVAAIVGVTEPVTR